MCVCVCVKERERERERKRETLVMVTGKDLIIDLCSLYIPLLQSYKNTYLSLSLSFSHTHTHTHKLVHTCAPLLHKIQFSCCQKLERCSLKLCRCNFPAEFMQLRSVRKHQDQTPTLGWRLMLVPEREYSLANVSQNCSSIFYSFVILQFCGRVIIFFIR